MDIGNIGHKCWEVTTPKDCQRQSAKFLDKKRATAPSQ